MEQTTIIGSGELDLGAYLGKTEEQVKVKLENSKVDGNASITCVITVRELTKEEFE